MIPDLLFYPLLLVVVWLCLRLLIWWPSEQTVKDQRPVQSTPPQPKRSREPQPFPGFLHKPLGEACKRRSDFRPTTPSSPPPVLTFPRGRRTIDTQQQFCPGQDCSYYGWLRRGNIRANGHPGGNPWRQFQCVSGPGYFHQLHGTPLHGKHVSRDQLVWTLSTLAEGLGIRAVARVFEVDPNTVLQWLVEAAAHLQAFSHYFLRDVEVAQVQREELFALLSAIKNGEVPEADAIKRPSRASHWVWVAMEPRSKLLLAFDIGDRTLAMAQRLVHQVTQVLAPHCAPLFLTAGFREYLTALATHYGQWRQPERCHATGPMPKPRWMPQPGLL